MTVIQKINMDKVEYLLGVSYKEALDMINRNLNATYSLIEALQERVLELEKQVDGLLNNAT
jgi:hypothetical protein